MISKYRHKELVWVDLEAPEEEEILHVLEQHSIPLSIEDEIRINSDDSKTILKDGVIYTSLFFPQFDFAENKVLISKIIIIINNNFILTIHSKPVEALGEFLKNLELDTTLPEQLQIKHTDLLAFYLIKSLYVNLKEKITANDLEISNIENIIFNNKDSASLIYNKNQLVINTDQIIGSHGLILSKLSSQMIQIFGDKFENYPPIILEEFYEIKHILDSQYKNLLNLFNLNSVIAINKNRNKLNFLTTLSIVSLIIIMLVSLYVFSNI